MSDGRTPAALAEALAHQLTLRAEPGGRREWRLTDVVAEGDDVVVRFTWESYPCPLAYRFLAFEPLDRDWYTDDWALQAAELRR